LEGFATFLGAGFAGFTAFFAAALAGLPLGTAAFFAAFLLVAMHLYFFGH
jgi:hypothetical protein